MLNRLKKLSVLAIFSFCAISSSFGSKIDWQKLPPALRLPPLETDQQKIDFLNSLEKDYPGILDGSAEYDVNPIQLLTDFKNLVETLIAEHPDFVEAYSKRTLLNLDIHPTKQGIQVKSKRISSSSVLDWKKELRSTFDSLNLGAHPIAHTIADQMNKNTKILYKKWEYEQAREKNQEAYDPILKLGAKLEFRNFFVEKVNRKKDVPEKLAAIRQEIEKRIQEIEEKKEKKSPDFTPELSKYLAELSGILKKTKSAFEDWDSFQKKYAEYAKKEYLEAIQIENQQQSLQQVYSILRKNITDFEGFAPTHENIKKAKEEIWKLTDQDMLYLSDPDTIGPNVKHLLAHQKKLDSYASFDGYPEKLQKSVENRLQSFTQQLRSYTTEIKNPIRLKEVPPWIAILRGLISGDCATRYSFPYPTDPNERVFVLYDHEGKRKGTVTGTFVDVETSDGKREKGFYVITIAGKQIDPADTELVFQGLESLKNKLGVDHIVLPEKKKLSGLINYPQIAGVYNNYLLPESLLKLKLSEREKLTEKNTVKIHYRGKPIRKTIEGFHSEYNSADYDKMVSNQFGYLLKTPQELVAKAQLTEAQVQPTAPIPMSSSELIDFAFSQHYSKRYALVNAILNLPKVKSQTSSGKFSKAIHLLRNKASELLPESKDESELPAYLFEEIDPNQKPLKVTEFENAIKKAFQDLGLDQVNWSQKSQLLYEGRLESPDAFEPEHLEETARLIAKDFKLRSINAIAYSKDQIKNQEAAILKTSSGQAMLRKLEEDARSSNDTKAVQALSILMGLDADHYQLNISDSLILKHFAPYLGFFPLEHLIAIKFRLLLFSNTHSSAWTDFRSQIEADLQKKLLTCDELQTSNALYILSTLPKYHPKTRNEVNAVAKAIVACMAKASTPEENQGFLSIPTILSYHSKILKLNPPLDPAELEMIEKALDSEIANTVGKLVSGLNADFRLLQNYPDIRVREKWIRTFLDTVKENIPPKNPAPYEFISLAKILLALPKNPETEKFIHDFRIALKSSLLSQKYSLPDFASYLVDDPKAAFWSEEREIVRHYMSTALEGDLSRKLSQDEYLGLFRYWSQKPSSSEKDQATGKLKNIFPFMVCSIRTIRDWYHFAFLLLDEIKKLSPAMQARMRSNLFYSLKNDNINSIAKILSIIKTADQTSPKLIYWFEKIPELKEIIAFETNDELTTYLNKHHPHPTPPCTLNQPARSDSPAHTIPESDIAPVLKEQIQNEPPQNQICQ